MVVVVLVAVLLLLLVVVLLLLLVLVVVVVVAAAVVVVPAACVLSRPSYTLTATARESGPSVVSRLTAPCPLSRVRPPRMRRAVPSLPYTSRRDIACTAARGTTFVFGRISDASKISISL